MKESKNHGIDEEEFSIEFGDVNGIKLYEFPFITQKNEKKSPPIKKK